MNHVNNTQRMQRGFTIIELLLAMSFVSMLLLAIAMTVVQIANIYNKGLILKNVNETSRSVGEELTTAMRTSSVFSLEEGANRYVEEDWGGRLCLGQYSYIWNYAAAVNEQNTNRNLYSERTDAGNQVVGQDGVGRSEIGMVKVPDGGGAYCVRDVDTNRYPNVDPENAVELLRSGDHILSLHDFTMASSPSGRDSLSAQQLFYASYVLGTSDTEAIEDDLSGCKPSGQGADPNYCVVQTFSLVFRVANGVN